MSLFAAYSHSDGLLLPPESMISITHFEKSYNGGVKERSVCPICSGALKVYGTCTQSLVYKYQNRQTIIEDRMVQLVLQG